LGKKSKEELISTKKIFIAKYSAKVDILVVLAVAMVIRGWYIK